MKKRPLIIAAVAIVLSFLFVQPPSASAQDALRKFSRGVSNVAYGWLDVPLTIHREDELNGPFAAYTYGIFNGFKKAFTRMGVGTFEILTFPAGWPDAYWPVINPEFPLMTYNENVMMYE